MKVTGIKFDQGRHPQGRLSPTAIVLHRTYGLRGRDTYQGAYSIGRNGRDGKGIGFHFLVGKNEGQAAQFYDTNVGAAHAKGANTWAVGVEFDGVNEDPLTDWQVRMGALIIGAVCDGHRIPRTYTLDGGRRRINGCLPHALVPGSDHTDLITLADWRRIEGLWAPAPTPNTEEEDDMGTYVRTKQRGRIVHLFDEFYRHLPPQLWEARQFFGAKVTKELDDAELDSWIKANSLREVK